MHDAVDVFDFCPVAEIGKDITSRPSRTMIVDITIISIEPILLVSSSDLLASK
jgi:hypothetical protein